MNKARPSLAEGGRDRAVSEDRGNAAVKILVGERYSC